MLSQYVKNYEVIKQVDEFKGVANGASASPKELIFHILDNQKPVVQVLDIGFGAGLLGELIKSNEQTKHWSVDGVDGWEANCNNKILFEHSIYRNIWHGLAQDLSQEQLTQYDIICLLDVIEHLTADTAKFLLKTLLTSLNDNSYLFLSTPLWFYPQDSYQAGDLEEHLIGVPASCMLSMCPIMYAVNYPLVGGFVFSKKSLDFIELFQPIADKSFTYERGMRVSQAVGMRTEKNVVFKIK